MPSEVILRLGSHAEKDYLLKTMGLFSGAIVGANLLEMTPGATVSLGWKMDSAGKRFLIDPMTYVFAIDLDYLSSETKDRKTGKVTKDIKRSFKDICGQLGDPFESVIIKDRRSLVPKDLSSDRIIDDMCRSVMAYQTQRMKSICDADPQLQDFSDRASPSAVFCPYFYIPGENTTSSQEWEDVFVRVVKAFGKIPSQVPKYAVLCVARGMLKDRVRMRNLLANAIESGCDACWLWISAFREEDITVEEITNLELLVRHAEGRNFPLWNMHGGFLSCLLSKRGLVGLSHGIGYGESKDVLPISAGALPTVAYHYNPLHVRASVLEIERAFSSIGVNDANSFHEIICNCTICKGVLKGNLRNFAKFGELALKPGNQKQSQTAGSAKLCRFHFLLARKKELDLVNGSSADDLRKLLNQTVAEYHNLGQQIRLRERAAALQMWIRSL
ncbi:MAG TPA: hypothetical protein VKG86_03570 [Terracidiphilus sp.]|nr:hypothetical protein [Terracidiphilus sp.]